MRLLLKPVPYQSEQESVLAAGAAAAEEASQHQEGADAHQHPDRHPVLKRTNTRIASPGARFAPDFN